tara:strand:+ start:2043 stop:2417 length:375 start_codon:yes stop_codon:yes gene_type:complete
MKVTKNYIKQLVKEELEKTLAEGSDVRGFVRILSDDLLEYNIMGKFGSVRGRQAPLIAMEGFAKAGEYGRDPKEAAMNAGKVWSKMLRLPAESIASALLSDKIQIQIEYGDGAESGGFEYVRGR